MRFVHYISTIMATQSVRPHVQITERPVAELRPYARNARTHSKKQIRQIAASIERFGFTNPVLVSDDGEIIAGHGRVEAAKLIGLATVPTLALSHLSDAPMCLPTTSWRSMPAGTGKCWQ